jgi:hypothetical protein
MPIKSENDIFFCAEQIFDRVTKNEIRRIFLMGEIAYYGFKL